MHYIQEEISILPQVINKFSLPSQFYDSTRKSHHHTDFKVQCSQYNDPLHSRFTLQITERETFPIDSCSHHWLAHYSVVIHWQLAPSSRDCPGDIDMAASARSTGLVWLPCTRLISGSLDGIGVRTDNGDTVEDAMPEPTERATGDWGPGDAALPIPFVAAALLFVPTDNSGPSDVTSRPSLKSILLPSLSWKSS